MRTACMVSVVLLLSGGPLLAQDRPFVFTLTTGDASSRTFVVHYDIGYGDRAFEVLSDEGRLEQRLGLQAALGRRWTLVARVGLAVDERDTRTEATRVLRAGSPRNEFAVRTSFAFVF